MDNSIQRLDIDRHDTNASWAGYWAGFRAGPVPAGSHPSFLRAYRIGRMDAGLDPLDLEAACALAEHAFGRYAAMPARLA